MKPTPARPPCLAAETAPRSRPRPRPAPESRSPAARPAGQPRASLPGYESLDFPDGRTVLNTKEVAQRLDVSVQHVLDLIEAGKLRALDIGSSRPHGRPYYRIPIEAWRAFLQENFL